MEEKGFAVDDVMDKALLRHHADSYVGRILRATSRYHEAQSQTSRRMHQLLTASLERELTASESNELRSLRAEAGIAILGREIELAEFEQSRLQGKQSILEALERLISEEGERHA